LMGLQEELQQAQPQVRVSHQAAAGVRAKQLGGGVCVGGGCGE
jgi:hypothetical protein